ncbi:hypothetical protein AVEN_241992-1 [Araneus ventricosus]|uniref:Uncharacterized protein n=1 Tax=Araneus ventricosus TaxID=182803 RepID=A0A4Y2E9A7_ARAVE|nr:hypothetical protein AVEN_241992-1 [Araneus ventricosus]
MLINALTPTSRGRMYVVPKGRLTPKRTDTTPEATPQRIVSGEPCTCPFVDAWLLLCLVPPNPLILLQFRFSEIQPLVPPARGKTGMRRVLGRYPIKYPNNISMRLNNRFYGVYEKCTKAFRRNGSCLVLVRHS